jgi:magnesium transporter
MRDALRVFLRELGQGLVLGAFLGAIGLGPRTHVGERDGRRVGSRVHAAVRRDHGTIVGAMLPLLFTRSAFDPAIASSPFVASLVDVAGIIIYFNIAIHVMGLR